MSTEAEMIEAQRRVFESDAARGERHLIGPVELGILFEAARRHARHELQMANERLLTLNDELTAALCTRGAELMKARARILELEDHARVCEQEAQRLRMTVRMVAERERLSAGGDYAEPGDI